MADFYRRAEVGRVVTERHLTALAAVHVQTPLKEQAAVPCRDLRDELDVSRLLNDQRKICES